MSLRPLRDEVAIIPIEDPDITPSGLWVPDTAKQKADQGIIKYRGPDVKYLHVGDHVLFSPYSGTKISHADEGYLFFMPESAIHALVSEDPPLPIFPLHTIERILRDRLSEAQAKGKGTSGTSSSLDLESFIDDVLSRLRFLPTSEGFEY
jgi:chaperonin GroES